MSIESDRALLSEGSGEVSGSCGTSDEEAMSIENGRASLSCSKVAKLATEALAALDAGQIDLARERMATLVTAMAP
jgi:hypothetical protein